jgi:hypothetical protein
VQTFLPYESFQKTAECLDYRRLGKQRVEAMQLINILEGNGKRSKNGTIAWSNHPACIMWDGFSDSLKLYCNTMIDEWIKRGYNNTMKKYIIPFNISHPLWIGLEKFHSSHRKALLWKNQSYYNQFGWSEIPEYNYIWPTSQMGRQ